MPENNTRSRLKKFFNTLEDQPIDPSSSYYYPFLEESEADPIAELANRLVLALRKVSIFFQGNAAVEKALSSGA